MNAPSSQPELPINIDNSDGNEEEDEDDDDDDDHDHDHNDLSHVSVKSEEANYM